MIAFLFSSCRQDEASPIKNVKAGPKLLGAQAGNRACTTHTYFYGDEQKSLGNVFTKQILVAFESGLSPEEEASVVAKYNFVEEKKGQLSTNSAMLHNIELVNGLNCKQVEVAMEILAEDPAIAYVSPYFLNSDGLLGVSNEAIVTVKEGNTEALASLAATYNAEVLMPLSGETYLLRVDKNSEGNALELANYLNGQDGIAHAEPDFVVSLEVPEANQRLADRRSRSGSHR
ncbi:hypothetical protein [Pontibacter oryzae]|uniref:Uncharacterized protein n=1 Tax=Pontibacter oryzae TaxID=2304593 RepID=A0A399RVT5_9BACT|nr:hypothetical protein [Pontibacter oryzae]RIJ33962.1 hypothetical protein D1627_16415 [Pontibacter oryzae]